MTTQKSLFNDEIGTDIEKLLWYEKEITRISNRVQEQNNILEQLRMHKADLDKKKDDLILKLHNQGIVFKRHEHIFSNTISESNAPTTTEVPLTDNVSKSELYSMIQSIIKETLTTSSAPSLTSNDTSTYLKTLEKNLLDLNDSEDNISEVSSTAYIFDTPNLKRNTLPVISPTSLPVNTKR